MLQQTMLDVTIELAFRSLKRQEKLEAKDTSSSRYTVREIAKPHAHELSRSILLQRKMYMDARLPLHTYRPHGQGQ